MIIDWMNTEVTGISGIRIEIPNEAKISIFTDNYLTHITDDHFEINLIACLLDQIYIVPLPKSPPRYDDTPPDAMTFAQSSNSTRGPKASAPMMPFAYKSHLIWMHSFKISYFYMNTYFMFIFSQNNTLEYRLYLSSCDMHE